MSVFWGRPSCWMLLNISRNMSKNLKESIFFCHWSLSTLIATGWYPVISLSIHLAASALCFPVVVKSHLQLKALASVLEAFSLMSFAGLCNAWPEFPSITYFLSLLSPTALNRLSCFGCQTNCQAWFSRKLFRFVSTYLRKRVVPGGR